MSLRMKCALSRLKIESANGFAGRVLRCSLSLKKYSSFSGPEKYAPPGKYSYISCPAEVPLLNMTFGQLVDNSAQKYGDQEAVIVSTPKQVRKTFIQLKNDADDLAAGLLSLGLQKGDRVGIWGPNSYEWYLTHAAGMKAGLIIVNINPAYQTREIGYCLNKVGIKCLIIAEPFKASNYYKMISQTLPEILNCDPGQIKSNGAPSLTTLISMDEKQSKGCYTFQEILHRGTKAECRKALSLIEPLIQFDDVCNIQFTSGTTGCPKGVMLSHHSIINNGYLIGRRLSYNTKDKLCVPVPLFHCFGSVIGVTAALHAGSTAVFPSPGFSPPDILKSISNEKCTVVYGTPTMHIDVLHCPDFPSHDVSSLRLAVTGGAICPEELIKLMKAKYTVDNVASCYGMTETSPVSFQSLPTDSDALRAATVGYPLENTEVKIVDQEGCIVPVGEEGELYVRGYCNMLGYWKDDEKTRETIDTARWLRTGDLCVMNSSGHVRVSGRLKDVIIRGGENVYPREVEDFLHTHPKIKEAQVFGVPDSRMGEEVGSWICVKECQTLSEAEVKAYCKGKIAHYKIPRYVVFTSDFPKTTSGKIQKFVMRDETIKMFNIPDPSKDN